MRDAIDLDAYLVAAIVRKVDRLGTNIVLRVPQNLVGRVVTLDHRQHDGLAAWSTAARDVALRVKERKNILDGQGPY